MLDEELANYDGIGLASLVRKKAVSPDELLDVVISRIERLDPDLNFMAVKAYDHAKELIGNSLPDGPFKGVPWLLKDLVLHHSGIRCTSGSEFFEDFVADHNSVMVERLKSTGLVLTGTTNVPEFGYNIESANNLHGTSRNPWNTDHTPGGSSGGSASAVAARVVPIGHSGDGGGSTRIPASYTGLVGLKGSRGRFCYAPDYAQVWYGSGTDSCLSVSVRDTAAYCDALWGAVPGDPYEFPPLERPLLEELGRYVETLRIGMMLDSPSGFPVSPECRNAVEQTAKLCESMGHVVEEFDLKIDYENIAAAFSRMAAVITACTVAYGEQILGKKATQNDLMAVNWLQKSRGEKVSAVQHAGDLETIWQAGREIAVQCEPYDIVLSPVMPFSAPPVGSLDMSTVSDIDEFNKKLWRRVGFTLPYNLSGQPAISLPLFWDDAGMPIGIQFAAAHGQEPLLIRLASQFEQAVSWADKKPPISG